MSDERLRDLERRARAGGTAADAARYLLERVRSGVVPGERLRVAARLGHDAARDVLGVLGAPEPLPPLTHVGASHLEELARGVPGGAGLLVAVAVGLARLANPGGAGSAAAEPAAAWLRCPCPQCAAHAAALADRLRRRWASPQPSGSPGERAAVAAAEAAAAAEDVRGTDDLGGTPARSAAALAAAREAVYVRLTRERPPPRAGRASAVERLLQQADAACEEAARAAGTTWALEDA